MLDAALKSVLSTLLRPLVRHLIGRGWGYPALCELLKSVYVAVAEEQAAEEGGRSSDSRLSLVTGIHRKEVKRLRRMLRERSAAPLPRRGASIAARAVAQWTASEPYADPAGEPRVLPLQGPQPSFESLIQDLKADLRHRAVLDELLRVGAVELVGNDRVRLVRNAYVSPVPEEKLEFLAANVGDHLRSALHNIASPERPYLERALFYDSVPSARLQTVRPELVTLAESLLKEANRRLMGNDTVGTEPVSTAHKRMRLGVYYYEDDESDDSRA